MTDNRISHIRQILASTLSADLKCRTISEYLDSFERWDAVLEREVRNEEAYNADAIERQHLRGITAPDYLGPARERALRRLDPCMEIHV